MSSGPGIGLSLVGGGVRSGKSAFALGLARTHGERRGFIATAQAFDDEMRQRIVAHRDERGGAFDTVEAPIDLPGALRALADRDVVLIDCLTLWLSNLLLAGHSEAESLARVDEVLAGIESMRAHCILVTNEVGMGIVPESALGRRFRDLAGRAHQRIAHRADRIYLAALGCVLRLRPGPAELVSPGGDPTAVMR